MSQLTLATSYSDNLICCSCVQGWGKTKTVTWLLLCGSFELWDSLGRSHRHPMLRCQPRGERGPMPSIIGGRGCAPPPPPSALETSEIRHRSTTFSAYVHFIKSCDGHEGKKKVMEKTHVHSYQAELV